MENQQEKFDIIVIGGGPSGLMAAIAAAENGARVAMLEKNDQLAKKLMLTGNRRCNLTQAQFAIKRLVEKYGPGGKFLFSSFAAFGPEETIGFFEKNGLATKIESDGRVFPVSDRASDVLDILKSNLVKNNVEIIYGARVSGFERNGKRIISIGLKKEDGTLDICADNLILATGGKSHPETGSSGNGYVWATSFGHNIIPPVPSLVPLKVKETWIKGLQGVSLKDIEMVLYCNNKKQASIGGEMLFTHFGLSGPAALNLSRHINKIPNDNVTTLSIDLLPSLSREELDRNLQESMTKNRNKNISNILTEVFPKKICDVILEILNIDPDKKSHSITREEREKVSAISKDFHLTIEGSLGFEQAMITSGGVDIHEIDPRTMRSKIIDNLYFAGEIIDLDGPTGGYNLQLCWSTGHLAGTSAARKNIDK